MVIINNSSFEAKEIPNFFFFVMQVSKIAGGFRKRIKQLSEVCPGMTSSEIRTHPGLQAERDTVGWIKNYRML